MKTYRIFLASSAELQIERLAFVAFIHDYNKELKKYKISLEVEWWEDMDDHFNTSNKQQDYNEALKDCHFLIMLFWTKVGKYTLEEFNLGRRFFAEKGLPYIYCYEKKCSDDIEQQSKKDFLTSINTSGEEQFQTLFDDFVKVTEQFRKNFQRLLDDKNNQIIVPNTKPATLLSPNGASDPNVFIGRDAELKEIRKRLDKSGKLMLINAEGGIGKTTLAAKYWNESLHEYKRNAWLFCDNGIVNALKELAPKLKIDLAGMNEAQQIFALKHALLEVHDDFLLVLDNANDEEDIKVFKQEFEGFHWHVLITSRCQGVLDKEQELPITHLPPPLAKALFVRHYKEISPDFDALLDRLLEAIRYHTLLIEIFAKNMCESAELGIKIADFLQKLEKEGLHLGKHSFEIKTDYTIAVKAKAATTDQILDALYDFGKLNEEQRFMLVNLAFLPAEPYTLQFINSLLANETNRTDLDLRKTLKNLSKKGWIAQMENTYRLSPVVQDLLLHKNKTTLEIDTEDLLDRLNCILEVDAYNLLKLDLIEAKPFVKLIFQINKCLERFPSIKIGDLNFSSGLFFVNVGNLTNALKVYLYYSNIYKKLIKIDPSNNRYKHGIAISYARIGNIYLETGNSKKAFEYYEKYFFYQKKNFEENPFESEFKNGYGVSMQKLGSFFLNEREINLANKFLNQSYIIAEELLFDFPENLDYKNSLAIASKYLGDLFRLYGELAACEKYYVKAKEYYLKYNELKKQLYLYYPNNLSYLNGYALSFKDLGQICNLIKDEESLSYLLKSKELFELLVNKEPKNQSFNSGLANSYEVIGDAYDLHLDWEKAVINYDISRKILFEIVQDTNGKILRYVYNFALSCWKFTDQVKKASLFEILDKKELKKIRREGYKYIQPFYESGLLQNNIVGVAEALGDEGWFEF